MNSAAVVSVAALSAAPDSVLPAALADETAVVAETGPLQPSPKTGGLDADAEATSTRGETDPSALAAADLSEQLAAPIGIAAAATSARSGGGKPARTGSALAADTGAEAKSAPRSAAASSSPDIAPALVAPSPEPSVAGLEAPDQAVVTPQTVADLAAQTAAQATPGQSSQFQIVLNPVSLGRVTVAVGIQSDGRLSADFAFEKPQAASALSAHASDLQRALQQSGFNVSDTGLSFSVAHPTVQAAPSSPSSVGRDAAAGPHGFGQSFGQSSSQNFGQSAQQNPDGSGQARGRAFAAGALTAAAADPPTPAIYLAAPARGVDIRI